MAARSMNVVLVPAISDGSGVGHLQRCVTLARALLHSGHEPTLLLDIPDGRHLADFGALVPSDVPMARLTREVFDRNDDNCSGRVLRDWIVIDDYDSNYLSDKAWAQHAERILVLDDHAESRRYADIVLSQTLLRKTEDYEHLVPEGCTVLTGAQYTLIRPEFASVAAQLKSTPRGDRARKIFVAMGGTDGGNFLIQVLKSIEFFSPNERPVVHVMIAKFSAAAGKLPVHIQALSYQCFVHEDVRDPTKILTNCDVAITAGGMTSYEVATLGIPAVIIPANSLEAEVAESLTQSADVRVIKPGGKLKDSLLRALEEICNEVGPRRTPSLDGRGSFRVVRAMEAKSFGNFGTSLHR